MDLQIREDIDLQRRTWRFERAGWSVLALILAAALLGLFGPGLFGTARASAANGMLTVEYLRFLRAESPQSIRVTIRPQNPPDGRFGIWIDAAYVHRATIERITPEPAEVQTGAERITFQFAWDGVPGPVTVTFALNPDATGRLHGRIGTTDGAVTDIRQFVHP